MSAMLFQFVINIYGLVQTACGISIRSLQLTLTFYTEITKSMFSS